MTNYEINFETLLLIPINHVKTKIIEKNDELIINKSCFDIIKDSCEYFGSSYEGRHKGTKRLIGVTHKSPIIIEEQNGLIFFPTISPREDGCVWICLQEVKRYYKENYKTVIEFHNGFKFVSDVSYGSIDNQVLRASRLQSVLQRRVQFIEKRVSF